MSRSSGGGETTRATKVPSFDPITLELVRNTLLSICEEMAGALVRSSHSPNIKERRDCSCCLYLPTGEMAVQAEHIPIHLGVMPYALKGILAQFPPERMQRGDTFIVNDPYYGGNHLPDFIIAGPLYLGNVLVGFAASMAHHNDVGGLSPRSMPATATEIFQEGLRVPPIQLSRGWEIINDVVRLISVNSRTPAERVADLRAQIATVRLAQRRIEELGRSYSAGDLLDAVSRILDLSEVAMRKRLREFPPGQWRGESIADYAGTPFPIKVRVEIQDGSCLVDFDGTSSQSHGVFNSCLSNTYASVLMALRVVLGGEIPPNGGLYRPLKIAVPEGTILNPRYPAAVSAATQVSYHTFEALMRALAPLAPHLVLADSGGGGVFSFGGRDLRSGSLYAYGEAIGGGFGAGASGDGESAVMPPVANLKDTPVEALEMSLPIRIERYGLVGGSGGAGKFRGGLGIRRYFRMLSPATCAFQISMNHKPPYGIEGGNSGAVTRIRILSAEGQLTAVNAYTTYEAQAGDVIMIDTAGGGGYGPPAERSPELARTDMENGYVSAAEESDEQYAAAQGASRMHLHGGQR